MISRTREGKPSLTYLAPIIEAADVEYLEACHCGDGREEVLLDCGNALVQAVD